MSKDLTPKEQLIFEKYAIEKTGSSIWDFLEHTTMHYNGETFPLCPPEELVNRKKFPYIGKLLEGFAELYDFLAGIDGGLELLQQKDRELARYVEVEKGDPMSYVIRWFEGTLDPHFYYSEHNHKLFCEELRNEALAVSRTKNKTN